MNIPNTLNERRNQFASGVLKIACKEMRVILAEMIVGKAPPQDINTCSLLIDELADAMETLCPTQDTTLLPATTIH